MIHLKRRSLCKRCSVCFVRDNDTQVYCHSCLEDASFKAKKVTSEGSTRTIKCAICSVLFERYNARTTCGKLCQKELVSRNVRLNKKTLDESSADKEGLSVEALKWLKKKPKAFPNALPFHELNRRSEYSRVFGKYSEVSLYFKRKGYGKV